MVDAIDEVEQEALRKRSWRLTRLQVASHAHSSIEVSGWVKWFPADHISVWQATGVTVADHCRTIQKDHYHVRRASISMAPLLDMTNDVRSTLGKLLKDPQSSGATHDFQDALRRQLGPPRSAEQTKTDLPVRRYFDTSVWDASVVQLGDHSRLNTNTHYVIEETTFKLAELLVDNANLVTSFTQTLLEPDNTSASNSFLHDTIKMAGKLGDIELLGQISEELGDSSTSVRGFFGLVQVEQPTTVAIGVGNTLKSSYRLDVPTLKPDSLLADIDDLRNSLGLKAPELPSFSIDIPIDLAAPILDDDDLLELPSRPQVDAVETSSQIGSSLDHDPDIPPFDPGKKSAPSHVQGIELDHPGSGIVFRPHWN